MTLLLLAGLLVPAQNVLAQTVSAPLQPAQAASPKTATAPVTAAHKTRAHALKTTPEPEVPQTPPPPPTLEQQAPVPPQVAYQNGQLTIDSQNATLSQVLRSVQTTTGASIDIPPGAGSERVVARLGPGTPKDVLAALLNGSKFNYVILGTPNQPGGVQKVMLLSKSTAGDNSTSMAAQNNIHGPVVSQAVEPPEDEYPPPDQESENQQLQPGQPGMPGSEGLTSDATNASPALIAPGNRTPEQMLQELQRMQQQQQQMQQQLNPVNQQPAPTPFPPQPGTASPQPQ